MAHGLQISPFADCHMVVVRRCDAISDSVLSLDNVYRANDIFYIKRIIAKIQETADTIRETYHVPHPIRARDAPQVADTEGFCRPIPQNRNRNSNEIPISPIVIPDLSSSANPPRPRPRNRNRNQHQNQNADENPPPVIINAPSQTTVSTESSSDLERRPQKVRNQRDRRRTDVDAANRKPSRRHDNNEDLRSKLASKSEETGDFKSAAEQYEILANMKADEKGTLLQPDQLSPNARLAEAAELEYKFKYGKMLTKIKDYSRALTAFEQVFQGRKDHYRDPNVQSRQTREAQIELCSVLRLLGSPQQLGFAEGLYHSASNLESQASHEGMENRTWALRNAFKQACVRFELGHCDVALSNLNYVWSKRHDATSECIQEMESEIVNLLTFLEQRNNHDWANSVLQVICQGQRPLSSQLVDALTTRGLDLFDKGQYAQTVQYLQTVWDSPSMSASSDGKLRLGWPLAWSLCHSGQGSSAEPILDSLHDLCTAQTDPTDCRVKALLAHAQLKAGKFVEAKQNAQWVYDRYKTGNILQSPGHHHIDTLIRALTEEKLNDEKWAKLERLWRKLYDEAWKLSLDRRNRDRVAYHAETGQELVKAWNRWRKNQPKRSWTSLDRIRAETDLLRGRT